MPGKHGMARAMYQAQQRKRSRKAINRQMRGMSGALDRTMRTLNSGPSLSDLAVGKPKDWQRGK